MRQCLLNEGGQSAAGAAIDRLIAGHAARGEAEAQAGPMPVAGWLAAQLGTLGGDDPAVLAGSRIVVPDFLGNRAPLADPHRRAIIAGLGMETGLDDLIGLYAAGLCGIGYGLRQILDAQREAGLDTSEVVVSGGAGTDPVVGRILADCAGVPVAVPGTREPVLLGAAILGRLAAGDAVDAQTAMAEMSSIAERHRPNPETAKRHARSYARFLALQAAATP